MALLSQLTDRSYWTADIPLNGDVVCTSSVVHHVTLRLPIPSRPTKPENTASNNPGHLMKVRHPIYSVDYNQRALLTLHAFDSDTGSLQYGSIFLSCAIVARNSWKTRAIAIVMGPAFAGYPVLLLGTTSRCVRAFVICWGSLSAFNYPITLSSKKWRFPFWGIPDEWSFNLLDSVKNQNTA